MVAAEAPDEDEGVEPDEQRRRCAGRRPSSSAHRQTSAERRRGWRAAGSALNTQNDVATPSGTRAKVKKREQRPVRAEQLVPVADREGRIAVRLERGDRRVRVEAVDDLHPSVVEVVEDVGQDSGGERKKITWRATIAADRPPRPQAAGGREDDEVADEHAADRPLGSAAGWPGWVQRAGRSTERPGHPPGELDPARRREDRRPGRGDADVRQADDDHQADRRVSPRRRHATRPPDPIRCAGLPPGNGSRSPAPGGRAPFGEPPATTDPLLVVASLAISEEGRPTRSTPAAGAASAADHDAGYRPAAGRPPAARTPALAKQVENPPHTRNARPTRPAPPSTRPASASRKPDLGQPDREVYCYGDPALLR